MTPPDDMTVKAFWPTVFYQRMWREHGSEAPAILAHLYELKMRQALPVASGVATGAKSAAGLYEGDFDLFANDVPPLRRLRAFLIESVRLAAVQVNRADIDPQQVHVEIVDAWYHITNEGGFHDAHYHGGCSWCGIYYVRVGDTGPSSGGGAPNGGTRFYSPLAGGGCYRDFGNKYLDLTYLDAPARDGSLILFPSYLLHSGLPYRGKEDRVVIAFNCRAVLDHSV